MKKILLSACCITVAVLSSAQTTFQWAKKMGGSSFDRGFAVTVDGAGNVYTTGYFNGTVDFDPGAATFNLTSAGVDDIFISKLDASGNFSWAKKIGGTSYEQGMSIAVDGSGNVYSTGYFQATADFDPGASTFNLTSLGNTDIFILKLDASGNFLWAKQMGGTSSEQGKSLAIDGAGNIYTTGSFSGTVDFDPNAGTFNLTTPQSDIFVSKLDASGNFVWAKQMGGNSVDNGSSIAVDGSGNVYTTGSFIGTTDFDPGPGTYNLTYFGTGLYTDIFVSKLDASGNFVWAKQMGGAGTSDDYGASIAVDGSGNVYTTGRFYGTADFDPGAGIFNLNAAGLEIFVSKLDALGNFVWAKQLGGNSTGGGFSIALDPSGNVYTTGYFYGTADFDPGAGTYNLISAGASEVYVSKLNASGNFVWAVSMGGTSYDEGYAIYRDSQGNIYTTGSFTGTADFDPGAGTSNLVSSGGIDIFVNKMSQCTATATITAGGPTTFCTGGSVVLNANTGSGFTYQWQKDGINISGATSASYTAAVAGNYVVVVSNSCGSAASSAIAVVVNPLPTATITAGGPTTFCSGGSVTLTANSGTGLTYQWKNNGNNISGATNISFVATSAASYTVVVTNSNSCSNTSSAVVVTISTIPTATTTPSGSATYCSGGSVTLLATTGAGYTYQWIKNAVNISGATLSSYSANTAGSYAVMITNSCGSSTSPTVSVTEISSPSATITAGGSLVFCTGGSVLLSANTGAGFTYQWRKNAVNISGATAQTYSATATGNHTVQITSGSCSAISNSIGVTVETALVPTISENSTVFCPGTTVKLETVNGNAYAYQWFEDTYSIPAATAYQFNTGHNGNYKVSVTNTCGTYTSSFYNLNNATLAAQPFTIIAANNLPTICPGGNVTLYDANYSYYYPYNLQWYKDGIAIPSAYNNSYVVTQPGNYSVAVSTYNFYCWPNSITVFSNWITVTSASGTYPTINISPSGPTTFCTGGSVVLQSSVTGSAPLTYQWKLNGADIAGATLANYTASSTGSYSCVVTNPCKYVTSNTISVTAQTLTATITSNTTNICGSGGTTLYCSTQTGNAYQWKLNGSNISGATSANYFAPAAGDYSCTVTNTCGTVTSNSITITVRPIPTAVISGTQTICSGNSATLTINFTGTGSWHGWYSNGSYYTLFNSGSNPYTFNVSPTSTTTYTLYTYSFYDAYCNGTVSGSAVVTVNGAVPVATITPSGSTTFCQGGSVQLNASTGSGYTYQWKLNSTNIPGATNSTFAATATGNYTVVVTNSCGSATSAATVVTVNSAPAVPSPINGISSVCPAQSGVIYSVTTVPGATSYLWTLPSGATGTSSTNSITINFSGFSGGNICVQAVNSCGYSLQSCLAVSPVAVPAMPTSITGTTTPCANTTGIIYSCPSVSGATSYTWTVPATATITSGQGTTSIAVNFGAAFTSGALGVSAVNCGGSSAQKTLNVYGIPAIPGAITGQKTEVCAGTNNVSYSIAAVGGASTYTWTAPANSTIASGQGTVSIVVNYNTLFTSGTLSVTAGNSCGTSAVKSATIRAKPPTPGTITGPATFCGHQQGVAYSIAAVSGATTYDWLVPTGAIVAAGQGTTAITVNFGTKNGKVKVSAGNLCGFSAYKQLTVTKNCREAENNSNNENEFDVKVYPNPSSDDFVFEMQHATTEKISINVYDKTGKLVESENTFNSKFIIRNLQLVPGIYSAVITDGNIRKVIKLVKIK